MKLSITDDGKVAELQGRRVARLQSHVNLDAMNYLLRCGKSVDFIMRLTTTELFATLAKILLVRMG